MARRSGRAPLVRSVPSRTILSSAASVTTIFIPLAIRRWRRSSMSSSAMRVRLFPASFWNTTISSTRLMNSGRNKRLSSPIARPRISSAVRPVSPVVPKPTLESCAISRAPTLLVMMTTVLRKSTVLPWLSVRRPSSSTCSKILKISGCAFSISSNSTTEYGLRRTALVSWPPSSCPT